MKIRLDFVTNSSSSSFTCVALYSEELYEFLQKLIADKKYRRQPSWSYNRPEEELHLDCAWEELKFDRTCHKVQTTEEYGNTDKESVLKQIGFFFEGLTPAEKQTLKELVFDVYKHGEYQFHKYKDQTDGFVGFNFNFKNTKADEKDGKKEDAVQKLIDEINEMAVNPESEDFSMKSIAMPLHMIEGYGIFGPDSDRYKHIDKGFLDNVRPSWISGDNTPQYNEYLLNREKKREWGKHLRDLYDNAIDDIGAICIGNISSRSDYAVIFDSFDGSTYIFELEQHIAHITQQFDFKLEFNYISDTELEKAKRGFYIRYLKFVTEQLKEANKNRGDRGPVKVIWESRMHDYLMKHSSLGNVEPAPVIGPNGTKRLKVPERHKKTIDATLTEMVARWPSRVINPKTKTYEKIVTDLGNCINDIGYASIEDFFDAYGFSIKQDAVRSDTLKTENYEYTKTQRSNEVTIVKYIGNESKVIIPETIDGGIVKCIGTDAFTSNYGVEEVIVPDTVDNVRGKAFAFCRNLKRVHLSDNIEKLTAETFDGCTQLEEINIPDNVEQIPNKAFINCPLKVLHIGKSLREIERFMFYQGEDRENGEWNGLFQKTCRINRITISPENRHLKVDGSMILTHDGKVLFAMLGDNESCIIPDGVEIIADMAFMNQSRLEEVVFPETLKIIGNYAFSSTGLRSVKFPGSLKTIGAKAFYCCTNLEEPVFSEGLEEIYSSAFNFTNITRLLLPNSLNKIGNQAFSTYSIRTVEPEKWWEEINTWSFNPSEGKQLNTKTLIDEIKRSGRKEAADKQLNDNTIGIGILSAMIAYLQSEDADKMELSKRFWLEKMVVSKELQNALGVDLKPILSFYKKNATEQLINCINAIKEEADANLINDYFEKIREVLSENSATADEIIDGTLRIIGKEA